MRTHNTHDRRRGHRRARLGQILLAMTASMLIACNPEVTVSPTAAPMFNIDPPPGASQRLRISGTFTTLNGACLEATILLDGRELAGARTSCPDSSGCDELVAEAWTNVSRGRHTIALKVVDQTPAAVDYVVRGVALTEDTLLPEVVGQLGPTEATLRRGQSKSFVIQVDP